MVKMLRDTIDNSTQPETVSVALGRIHVEFFVQCLNLTIGRK